ncbi:MAG: hypothetical protein ACUVV3_10185 [Dehalococcoidia bacterium]
MGIRKSRRLIYWGAAVIVALAVGVGCFLGARTLADDGSGATAEPKALPADWDRYFNEDAQRPRFNQEINGILVGPTAPTPDYGGLCDGPDVELLYPPAGSKVGGDLDFEPGYLPEGVDAHPQPDHVAVRKCSGTIVTVWKEYQVPSKFDQRDPTSAPLWSGGEFSIMRERSTVRAFPLMGAAERMGPITIAGRPAVLMRPVMPEGVDIGMGDMAIVIAEDFGLTAIQGSGLPLSEFIKIAEGLYSEVGQ